VRETERKYEITDGVELPGWADLSGVDALVGPEEQRAIVHLKLWEQMTFAQIAESLDIPANTAASRYRYGLDKLQALLRPLYEELQ